MQEPEPARPPGETPKRPLTSAEFFGVPQLPKAAPPETIDDDRPDWYRDWLSKDRLRRDFIVWFDAWEAVEFFSGLNTQWRYGFDGVTGLDYTAVINVIALYHPRKAEQQRLFEDIRALEHGAMFAFSEQRKTAKEQAERDKK